MSERLDNNSSLGTGARYIEVVVSIHGYASSKSSRPWQVRWTQMACLVLYFQHLLSLFDHSASTYIHTLQDLRSTYFSQDQAPNRILRTWDLRIQIGTHT
jgi:hypothetical protein